MDQSDDPEDLHSYSMTARGSAQEHLEIEGVISNGDDSPTRKVNRSWQLGRPWFVGASYSSTSPREEDLPAEDRYYGGIMKSDGVTNNDLPKQTTLPHSNVRSPLSGSITGKLQGTHTDEESATEFDESDWTPPDSSYGAACPVCGWIPKHARQKIEFSLIALSVFGFLWAVVATSTHVSNARKVATMQNETGYNNLALEDDFYVDVTKTDYSITGSYNTFSDDTYASHDDVYYKYDAVDDDGAY